MTLCQKSFTLVLKCAIWQNDTSCHSCYLRPASTDPGIAVQYPNHPIILCTAITVFIIGNLDPPYLSLLQTVFMTAESHCLSVLPRVIEVTVTSSIFTFLLSALCTDIFIFACIAFELMYFFCLKIQNFWWIYNYSLM